MRFLYYSTVLAMATIREKIREMVMILETVREMAATVQEEVILVRALVIQTP